MFLEVLGIVFLIIILIALYISFKIYWKIRRFRQSDFSLALSVLPDLDAEFEVDNNESWQEKEQLKFCESRLKSIGAKHVNYYSTIMNGNISLISMWLHQDLVSILIYEVQPEAGDTIFVVEAVCKTNNGGTLCISNNPSVEFHSRPETHPIYSQNTNDPLDLIKGIKKHIPSDQKIVKIKDAKDFLDETYEVIAEWGWRKEQLNSDYCREKFNLIGVSVNDDLIDSLIEVGRINSIDVTRRRALRSIKHTDGMTVVKWEKIKDQIIVISENMNGEDVLDEIMNVFEASTELESQILEGLENTSNGIKNPFAAFENIISVLQFRVKKIAKIEQPYKAVIFIKQ